MYGGYGGYGGMGGGMYGSSYSGLGGYGGYGGYGGMGMGGMGMGMYGMQPGGGYAESMFRMTQMLEMNSVMLHQIQEHVSMTYNRLRDVGMWIWSLKGLVFKQDPNQPSAALSYKSEEERKADLQRLKHRVKVILVLFGLFVLYVLKDSRRRSKEIIAEGAWMKAAEGILPLAAAAGTALENKNGLEGNMMPGDMSPMGGGMMNRFGMGGYGGMGMGMGGYGMGMGGGYGMGGLGGMSSLF